MSDVRFPKELREALGRLTKSFEPSGAVLNVSPATLGSSAAAVNAAIALDGFSRDVWVELVNGDGDVVDLANYNFAVGIADTSAGGTADISGITSIDLVRGVAQVTINYTGAWLATETTTLTVTGKDVAGVTIANKTSVDTLVA